MDKIFLKPKRDYSVRRRHPWIFSGAIEGECQSPAGSTVEVFDSRGESLGYGSYSPSSQIRVRMLSFDHDAIPDGKFIEEAVASSVGRRASFFADAYTNAMRLVNAEADGLPGVVADYYAGWVVCQFTSAGAERWKSDIAAALMKYSPFCLGVAARNDAEVRAKEGLEVGGFEMLQGSEMPELIEIREGKAGFLVDVRKGHKTGFYLDQRDARALVGPLGNGGEVLNCFCYTGGFGQCCRICGADRVVQVDVSREQLEMAKKNEALACICDSNAEYVEADVFSYLRKCRDEAKKFDLIVLDPPKFAESKSSLMKAKRGYKDINLLAMKLLRRDGILATFSCSGAMDRTSFDAMLAEAAMDARRSFQIIARTGAGKDHPVSLAFPEGEYLKGVVLRAD